MPSASVAEPPPDNRFREYLRDSVLSPLFYVKGGSTGVLDQINKMPEEWTGMSGFSRRMTSRVGLALAGDTISHSVAAALHHRVKYEACACVGTWTRTRHALSRTFVAVRDDGRLAPHYSFFASKYGPASLAHVWYPPSYIAADSVRGATVAVGVAAGFNVVREFTPELKRLAHIR